MRMEAGQVVDKDEEEDRTYDGALRDPVGKRLWNLRGTSWKRPER